MLLFIIKNTLLWNVEIPSILNVFFLSISKNFCRSKIFQLFKYKLYVFESILWVYLLSSFDCTQIDLNPIKCCYGKIKIVSKSIITTGLEPNY